MVTTRRGQLSRDVKRLWMLCKPYTGRRWQMKQEVWQLMEEPVRFEQV